MFDKHGKKFVKAKTKGGPSMLVDMTIDPLDDMPWTNLSELAEHVNREICQLEMEFGHLALRPVGLDDLFRQLAARKISENRLIKVFDGAVGGPLRSLFERIADLSSQLTQDADRDMREVLRTAAASNKDHFSKMLEAFEQMVDVLLRLNEEDTSLRSSAAQTLKEVNRLAGNGNQLRQRISGFKIGDESPMTGLEQDLEKLVVQTARNLADDIGSLKTKDALEDRWGELEHLLTSLRRSASNFAVLRPEYDVQVARFFREQDCIQLYRGEWARQQKAICFAREFFTAAGLDPFALSDKLAGVNPDQVLEMPDCQARDNLQALIPEDFLCLDDNRINRIVGRAENVIRQILEAITDLDKPAPKVAMVPTSPSPPVPPPVSPPLSFVVPPVSPPVPCPPPPQTGSCSVSFMELAVCTYAVFVPRQASGNPLPNSGRPVYRVYDDILVPSGMSFGCTREQFKDAVLEGLSNGLMRHFQSKGGKDLFQSTLEGFVLAEQLYRQLPVDFRQRIGSCYDLVKKVDSGFRG